MPQFACRLCGEQYEAPEELLGSKLPCPSCGREITAGESVAGFRGGDDAHLSDVSQFVASRSGALERKPGYASPMAWVVLIAGTAIVALALFGALSFLSLKFKPLPPWLVYWLPALLGVLAGATGFMNQANRHTDSTPTWITACAVLLAIPVAVGPILIFKSGQARSARVSLAQQINEALGPPNLPEDSPSCISVRIGKATEFPRHEIQIFLEGDRSYKGTADVNLSEAALKEGMPPIYVELATEAGAPAIQKMIDAYDVFGDQSEPESGIHKIAKAGRYTVLVTPTDKTAFKAVLLVSKAGYSARMERDSHIRAMSIPQAGALARRLIGPDAGDCEDVELGKKIDATHLQATARLPGEKEIPVVIELSDDDEEAPGVRVVLGFNESAIVHINEALTGMANYDGERCINVDRKRKLRTDEYSLRALFATAEPREVLLRQDGYDLSITPPRFSCPDLCRGPQPLLRMVDSRTGPLRARQRGRVLGAVHFG